MEPEVGEKLIKELWNWRSACAGCRQSKKLMRYPLLGTADKLLAMSKLWLRAAVGLLIGHLYKLGHTERQEYWLWGYDKEDSVHIVVTVLS